MLYSCRSRLIISFLAVSLLVGLVSLYVGSRLLYRSVMSEATNRINQDLNATHRIYRSMADSITTALTVASADGEIRALLTRNEMERLTDKLFSIAGQAGLDFAGVSSSDGRVVRRFGPNPLPREGERSKNPFVEYVLRYREPVSGTSVFSGGILDSENRSLAERAKITLVPSPAAASRDEKEETSGLTIGAAVPLVEGNRTIGVLYGGRLLNRSFQIVDTVNDTVFRNETYKGKGIGTAAIFLKDAAISTNMLTPDGNRAIGTLLPRRVYDHVLIAGNRTTDRAYLVSDWYISAYEPIIDIFGERLRFSMWACLSRNMWACRRRCRASSSLSPPPVCSLP